MKELLKAKSEFRKKGVVLVADKVKSGAGGSWRFAGEDNLIRTIQAPLTECGLELIVTMEYLKELSTDTVKATLYHVESGESICTQISLAAIEPKLDKNNNKMYLDAEIERGKQFGYWSRMLAIRILGLSDVDPEDMRNAPQDITDEARDEAILKLTVLIDASSKKDETIAWVNKRYGVDDYKNIKINQAHEAYNLLVSKQNASN